MLSRLPRTQHVIAMRFAALPASSTVWSCVVAPSPVLAAPAAQYRCINLLSFDASRRAGSIITGNVSRACSLRHFSTGASSIAPSASPPCPSSPAAATLTHADPTGRFPGMVDVGGKAVTRRVATAQSLVLLPDFVSSLWAEAGGGEAEFHTKKKGPVLATAIVAGTQAVKLTSSLIPFCHPLPVDKVSFTMERIQQMHEHGQSALRIQCTVACTARTGVEMEALTGASVAALTVYDMLKALSHDIVIAETKLLAKSGGKSDYQHTEFQSEKPAAVDAAAANCKPASSLASGAACQAHAPPVYM